MVFGMTFRAAFAALTFVVHLRGTGAASEPVNIGDYRDETFVELPYIYTGYLDSKLTPEIAVNILVDPCKEYDAGCCGGRYGVMEYFPDYDGAAEFQQDRACLYEGRAYPIECVEDSQGTVMSYQDLRISDYDIYVNDECLGEYVNQLA